MSPTPLAAGLVAAASATAFVLPLWVPALLILAILSASAYDAVSVRRRPEIEAVVPGVLAIGVPAPYRIRAAGPGTIRVRQANIPALRFEPQEAEALLEGTVVARLRGRHRVPAPATVSTGPLKLGRWWHRGRDGSEVVVYPDLPAARRIVRVLRESRGAEQGAFGRGPLGLGTTFESVREYSPDDDFRQINWLATARVGRPMTNLYRVERDRDVVCVIDTGRLMGAPLGPDRTRLDAALDATAAVALVADELGDRSGTVAFDSEVRRKLSPQRAGARRIVDATFDLEPTERDSDYELAFRAVGGGKRALVVVFTDLIDQAAARSLLRGAPFLARRHHLVVASASDPDLDALAEGRADGQEPSTQEVAQVVLRERAEVAERLRHAGAAVVDAAPRALAAECVRAYLSAKQRVRV